MKVANYHDCDRDKLPEAAEFIFESSEGVHRTCVVMWYLSGYGFQHYSVACKLMQLVVLAMVLRYREMVLSCCRSSFHIHMGATG